MTHASGLSRGKRDFYSPERAKLKGLVTRLNDWPELSTPNVTRELHSGTQRKWKYCLAQ